MVNAGRDNGVARGQAAIDRRRSGRAPHGGRQPGGAYPADYRSQLAHSGRRRWHAPAAVLAGDNSERPSLRLRGCERKRCGSATGSSPRARAACSRRGCRSALSPVSTAKERGSSPMPTLSQLDYLRARRLWSRRRPAQPAAIAGAPAVSARNAGAGGPSQDARAERWRRRRSPSAGRATMSMGMARSADRDDGARGALVDPAAALPGYARADPCLHADGDLSLDDLPAGSAAGLVLFAIGTSRTCCPAD